MKFFLSGPAIHKCISKNRWIFDSSNLLKQIHKWETQLPWIQPYYALKSNPSEEIIKILVSASPNQSSLSIYGRSNLGNDLIKINSVVDNSLVKIIISPADKSQTEKYTGSKIIFGVDFCSVSFPWAYSLALLDIPEAE